MGVGARALELAVAYVAEREQFGRRIGTYQAVSHPLASSHAELELARSLAWWAAWCVAEDDGQAAVAAASAKASAADAAVAACERAIQAHGGIGFTWEHALHRLYKRALWIQSWEASPAQLRAEVAGHLLDGGGGVMEGLMMDYQLNVPAILRRADELYGDREIVSRLPDKSWHRYGYADFASRTKRLAVALRGLGLEDGDRVATLMWNHHEHLETYIGAPVGGFVTHTLNLRLHPDDNTYIASHAGDKVLVVDKVLWPLAAQFVDRVGFEHVDRRRRGRDARGRDRLRGAPRLGGRERVLVSRHRRARRGRDVLHERDDRAARRASSTRTARSRSTRSRPSACSGSPRATPSSPSCRCSTRTPGASRSAARSSARSRSSPGRTSTRRACSRRSRASG